MHVLLCRLKETQYLISDWPGDIFKNTFKTKHVDLYNISIKTFWKITTKLMNRSCFKHQYRLIVRQWVKMKSVILSVNDKNLLLNRAIIRLFIIARPDLPFHRPNSLSNCCNRLSYFISIPNFNTTEICLYLIIRKKHLKIHF